MEFIEFTAARADTGQVLPFAVCTVYLSGTNTLAALFDANGVAISNPTIAGAVGQVGIAAANGNYDIQIASADGLYIYPTRLKVQFFDSTALTQARWVTLEGYGYTSGDAATAFQAACNGASALGAGVWLTKLYPLGGQVIPPAGLIIAGPRSAGIRRINQVIATTTTSIAAGGTSRTVTVNNATGFQVGQSLIFVYSSGTVASPGADQAFNHINPTITGISGNDITFARNGTTDAIPIGATIATAGRLLLQNDDCIFEGFTVDGNRANQTYGYWLSTAEVVQQGNRCSRHGLHFKDTFSDAVLVGGPDGSFLTGSWDVNCIWDNIGGNGVHYGNVQDRHVIGPKVTGCNNNSTGLNVAHNDGAFIDSNNCFDLEVIGGFIKDALFGVGAFGSTDPIVFPATPNINDKVSIIGTRFENCYRDVDIDQASHSFLISATRHDADYTPTAGPLGFKFGLNGRFDSHTIISLIGDTYGEMPREITIGPVRARNGRVMLQSCQGVDLSAVSINNREVPNFADQNAAFILQNCKDIKLDGGSVDGGAYAVSMQMGYDQGAMSSYNIPVGWMDGIKIHNLAMRNQVNGAITSSLNLADGRIAATIESCPIDDATYDVASQAAMLAFNVPVGTIIRRTDLGQTSRYRLNATPASTLANWVACPAWVGINLISEIIALNNHIRSGDPAKALTGAVEGDNARGNIINGDLSITYPIIDAFPAFTAAALGAVSALGSGVYSTTIASGTADTWRLASSTVSYGEGEAIVRVVPRSNDTNYRGQAGFTNAADPTTVDPLVGLDYGWLFFGTGSGAAQAFVCESGSNRTAGAAYSPGDIFWVRRRADGVVEYWKGGDGVTYSTGSLVFTSTFNDNSALKGMVSIRNGTGAIETKMLGGIERVAALGTASTAALDTDSGMTANSDSNVPSQKAVKTAIAVAVTGLLDLKGGQDCSANPNYPAALKGDAYFVTVAGLIGGASGAAVGVGDVFFATADNAGGTQAAVGGSWDIMLHSATGSSLSPTKRTVFSAGGTWTKSAGAKVVLVELYGAGGGGGGGIKTASATANSGGGAGGGGGFKAGRFDATALGATETVTVGAAGTGGATTVAGGAGGNSSFGSWLTAYGGGGGAPGQSAATSGGGGGAGASGAGGTAATTAGGAAGGIGGVAGATGSVGVGNTAFGCGGGGGGCSNAGVATAGGGFALGGGAGGGGGGGVTTTPGTNNGGPGGLTSINSTAAAGGAANTNGTAGGSTLDYGPGRGGGGGGSAISTSTAGNGGAGQTPGGGGGGGGSALTTGTAGAGGAGGAGLVVVTEYF